MADTLKRIGACQAAWTMFFTRFLNSISIHFISVADPEWFIPDPDTACEFFEFRIQVKVSGFNSYYEVGIFGNYKKTHLKFNQKEESTGTKYLPFSISYYSTLSTVLQHTQSRIRRPKMRNKIFIYLLFHFCWIQNNNSGSGSRQKFRIHPDPDLKHWSRG